MCACVCVCGGGGEMIEGHDLRIRMRTRSPRGARHGK